jgi:hypothetical protein
MLTCIHLIQLCDLTLPLLLVQLACDLHPPPLHRASQLLTHNGGRVLVKLLQWLTQPRRRDLRALVYR